MLVLNELPGLLDAIQASGRTSIAIDGFMGVGKSTLASQVADALGGRVVETDEYAISPSEPITDGYYPKRLDQAKLRYDLLEAAALGPVVVEGICMRDTISDWLTGVLFIYVKRLTEAGDWPDSQLIDAFEANPDTSKLDSLTASVLVYHYNRHPDEMTEIVFETRAPAPNTGVGIVG
jgi:hypothetical protein